MLFVSEKAREKIQSIMHEQNMSQGHFVRVTVEGGGCSGLSYKMDFDNQLKSDDQELKTKVLSL
jgi:iron-sulfur cluster assembly protein